jgi:hypothetical protein
MQPMTMSSAAKKDRLHAIGRQGIEQAHPPPAAPGC